jgi:DNA repair photolyase
MRVEEIQSKSILNPTGGFLSTFTHSLNAYQGCAFGRNGCPYCYVRAMPIQRFAGAPWGEWVRAKTNSAELLRTELAKARRDGTFGSLRVFMSTATDPYQGLEARLKLTRAVLDIFEQSGEFGWLVVQTRSPLVERDIDLLKRLGRRVMVSVTVETDRDDVRRAITPTSPSVDRRLECLRRLSEAGIETQAAISPLLPCNVERLASLVASSANRAVVDTLVDGDGAGGRRSNELGMPGILEHAGYAGWMSSDTHVRLLDELRIRMGADRVGFSKDGFNLSPAPWQ